VTDYWYSYIAKARREELIRQADQERLAKEFRRARHQQRAQLTLTSADPADLSEVLSWVPSNEAMIEWTGQALDWPVDPNQLSGLLLDDGCGLRAARIAWAGRRRVGFAALDFRHDGQVAELCQVLVKRHRRAVTLTAEIVHRLVSEAFAQACVEVLRAEVYAHDEPRRRAFEQNGFRVAILRAQATRVGSGAWDRLEMFLERPAAMNGST
jgi:RimJ/RimL family protein N-acetyltransferase